MPVQLSRSTAEIPLWAAYAENNQTISGISMEKFCSDINYLFVVIITEKHCKCLVSETTDVRCEVESKCI